jgi:ethanolamine utilization protein EutQ (cupin superfamily)
MFKIISSFTVLMGLASLAFSSTQMEEERQPKKITFNLPQVSAQEEALNAQMRNVLLETSRHFSLKQRLDAVRLLSLMDMYEAKIAQMRRFEKRNNDDTVQATKLVKERKEIRGKIQSFVNTFHSDWATYTGHG